MNKRPSEDDTVKPIPEEFMEVCRSLESREEHERFIALCESLDDQGQCMYDILREKKNL